MLTATRKTCGRCRRSLPIAEFRLRVGAARRWHESYCRPCARAYAAEWKANHPGYAEYQRRARLRHRYGIEADEYDALLLAQGGCCAICGAKPGARSLDVDHEHEGDKVRGLLCRNCNHLIGKCRESTTVLRKAIEYLERR